MNLLDAKILKDSSAKYVLWDMLRPEVQEELRADLKQELRAEVQEKVHAELEQELRAEMQEKVRAELKQELRAKVQVKIRAEEARSILVEMATDRFGPPTEPQKALLDGIEDHDRLVRLCKKVGSLATWEELLASESAP